MNIKRFDGLDPKTLMDGVESISNFNIPFEFKIPKKGSKNIALTIEGYASTNERDADGEIILPSAFDETLEAYMERGLTLFMHDWWSKPIGKAIEARTDSKGLYLKVNIFNTMEGKDIALLIEEGSLDSFSVGFGNTVRNNDDETIIEKLKLYENSVVNLGSNPLALFDVVKQNNIKLRTINTKRRSHNMDGVSTKDLKDLENMFTGKLSAIEDAQGKVQSLEDNIGKQENLIRQISEKAELMQKDRMTKGEFTTFATKIGLEIQTIQEDIQTAKKAIKGSSQRMPIYNWKAQGAALDGDLGMKFAFNDQGTPLSVIQQKAHHLFYTPVEYGDSDEGRFVKNVRDLHDTVYLTHAYAIGSKGNMHSITKLKSYNLFKSLMEQYDPEFAKAMYSTGTGLGDEWVPTGMSNQLYEAYELAQNIEASFPVYNMKSNPDQYPFKASHARMYRANEATSNNPDTLRKSNFGTGNVTFTAEAFAVAINSSVELIEDSIIAMVPELRKELAIAMARGGDSWIVNGDDTTQGTHMDTAAEWATDTGFPESYSKGLRKLAIAGSRTYNAQTVSAPATAAFEAGDIRNTRALLPAAYGHRSNDIIYATTLKTWIKILTFDEMAQFGTFSAGRTWASGDLTSFDGSRLILTDAMVDTYAATGLKTGSDATSGLLAYNASAFKVGQRRGITVEFEKNIHTQQWGFVATQRKDFKSMDASGSEAVAYCINIPN